MTEQQIASGYERISALVEALKADFPGISFGYIGNCGVDRGGRFDDRSWRVFMPHYRTVRGAYTSFGHDVYLGKTEALDGYASEEKIKALEGVIRRADERNREIRRKEGEAGNAGTPSA